MLTELALGLDRRRFEPRVFAIQPEPAPPRDELVARLREAGVPVHFSNARRKSEALRVVAGLTREWKAWRPAIVQTFLFHAGILGRFAAARARVPHLVAGIRVAERRQSWRLWLDRLASGRVERYACVSQSVADFTAHQGGIARAKLEVIPNGIDAATIASAPPAEALPGQRRILFAGRLDEQKRVDWLLRAASVFLPALPGHDLLIAGDGPQRDSLIRLAAELNISDRVHWLGFRSDVPSLLMASEMLVLGSAWEGMPNVVLEAMACGKPVVSTLVEGVEQALGARFEEQTAPTTDSDAFASRVIAIANDPVLAARLGEANRERVIAEFSLARMIAQYESLYERLLSGR